MTKPERPRPLPFDWYVDYLTVGATITLRETFLTKQERDDAVVSYLQYGYKITEWNDGYTIKKHTDGDARTEIESDSDRT